MREFYVDPKTPNTVPEVAPGFTAAFQLEDGPGLADKTFTKNIVIEKDVANTKQEKEKSWLEEHKATTTIVAEATHYKKHTNYRGREGVYQDNWHHNSTMVQLDDEEQGDDIDYVEISVDSKHHAGEEEEEAPAIDKN